MDYSSVMRRCQCASHLNCYIQRLAQSPGNLLYLDLPFPAAARLSVTGGRLRLPHLASPVSR